MSSAEEGGGRRAGGRPSAVTPRPLVTLVTLTLPVTWRRSRPSVQAVRCVHIHTYIHRQAGTRNTVPSFLPSFFPTARAGLFGSSFTALSWLDNEWPPPPRFALPGDSDSADSSTSPSPHDRRGSEGRRWEEKNYLLLSGSLLSVSRGIEFIYRYRNSPSPSKTGPTSRHPEGAVLRFPPRGAKKALNMAAGFRIHSHLVIGGKGRGGRESHLLRPGLLFVSRGINAWVSPLSPVPFPQTGPTFRL